MNHPKYVLKEIQRMPGVCCYEIQIVEGLTPSYSGYYSTFLNYVKHLDATQREDLEFYAKGFYLCQNMFES